MSNTPQLAPLPYPENALEPFISEKIMHIHYHKHHNAYFTNLNKALESLREAEGKGDVEGILKLQSAIEFNGGGHLNHSIFWTNMAPKDKGGGEAPKGELAEAIHRDFGSLEQFIEKFSATATAIQGSGWCWLGYNKAQNHLEIATCANQDPLLKKGLIPLLGLDIWEHAYYLQYENRRPEYVKAFWNVVNWKNVAERYTKAK